MTSFLFALGRKLSGQKDVVLEEKTSANERQLIRRALASAAITDADSALTVASFLKRNGCFAEVSAAMLRKHVAVAMLRSRVVENRRAAEGWHGDSAQNVQLFLRRSLNGTAREKIQAVESQKSATVTA